MKDGKNTANALTNVKIPFCKCLHVYISLQFQYQNDFRFQRQREMMDEKEMTFSDCAQGWIN